MASFEDFLRRAFASYDSDDAEPIPVPDYLRERILAEARKIASAGCAHPLSAERGGAPSAQDNPPATDDGSHG